jgi:hypothetical protein
VLAAQLIDQTGVRNTRTERIATRLKPQELAQLDNMAAAAGCSRAGLTAALVVDGLQRLQNA